MFLLSSHGVRHFYHIANLQPSGHAVFSRAATKETQCVILTLCLIMTLYPYKSPPSSYEITVYQCICTLHVKWRPDTRNRQAFLVWELGTGRLWRNTHTGTSLHSMRSVQTFARFCYSYRRSFMLLDYYHVVRFIDICTVMRRLTFRSTTDRIYDGGPLRL